MMPEEGSARRDLEVALGLPIDEKPSICETCEQDADERCKGCGSTPGHDPRDEEVPMGYLNFRERNVTITIDVQQNMLTVEDQLDMAYAKARVVINGIRAALQGDQDYV